MNRAFWVLSFTILIVSCGQTLQYNSVNKDSSIKEAKKLAKQQDTNIISENDFPARVAETWTDSLIERYIFNSNNDLIKLSLKNKLPEEWLFDQTINTDTAKYFVFQIGHDETDEGGDDRRFITDQWIYIDSAAKQLYEYDIASDSLIHWTK